jgi:hypothetical protein
VAKEADEILLAVEIGPAVDGVAGSRSVEPLFERPGGAVGRRPPRSPQARPAIWSTCVCIAMSRDDVEALRKHLADKTKRSNF